MKKTIKEAGQYTFDGDIVDSFYDDNKIYKACMVVVETILTKDFTKRYNFPLKKKAEELFASLTESLGEIPESTDLVDVIINWLLDDDQEYDRDEIFYYDIKQIMADEIQFGYDYQSSEEYWDDMKYLIKEGDVDLLAAGNLPRYIWDRLEDVDIKEDDLIKDIEDYMQKNYQDAKTSISEGYYNSTENNESYLVAWQSQIGETEWQYGDYIEEMLDSLGEFADNSGDDLESKLDVRGIDKDHRFTMLNLSDTWVSFLFDTDEVMDYIVKKYSK